MWQTPEVKPDSRSKTDLCRVACAWTSQKRWSNHQDGLCKCWINLSPCTLDEWLSVSGIVPVDLKVLATGVAADAAKARFAMVGPVKFLAGRRLADVRPVINTHLPPIRSSIE